MRAFAAGALAILTLACTAPWSPEEVAESKQIVAERDDLTAAEKERIYERIDDVADGFDTEMAMQVGAASLSTLVMALWGVRLMRGPGKPIPKVEADELRAIARERLAAKSQPKEATDAAT